MGLNDRERDLTGCDVRNKTKISSKINLWKLVTTIANSPLFESYDMYKSQNTATVSIFAQAKAQNLKSVCQHPGLKLPIEFQLHITIIYIQ